MMNGSRIAVWAAICAAIISFTAEAQERKRIPVDHDDPALQRFRTAPRSATTSQPELPPRDIPVLNFVQPPLDDPALPRAARKDPGQACKQSPVHDADPGWYAIRHDCGNVVITITGEQRIQSRSAAPAPRALAQPTVIVPATGNPRIEAGFVAEITLYRFGNIPYSITVECNRASIALCKSEDRLKALVEKIDLTVAPDRK